MAFFGTTVLAQNSKQGFSLPVGKEIISNNETVQNLDMGMGMLMKTNIHTTTQYHVISLTGDEYLISRKLTVAKISFDLMGETQTYDSDLEKDQDTEMGKEIGKRLNKPDTFRYNRVTGMATLLVQDSTETQSSDPINEITKSMGGSTDALVIEDIFFPVKAGRKTGDTWVDSLTSRENSYIKNYTVKSITKDTAEISFNSEIKNNLDAETQGIMLTINLDTKSSGTIKTDPVTTVVLQKTSNSTMEGSYEVMGQTMNISGDTSTTITGVIK